MKVEIDYLEKLVTHSMFLRIADIVGQDDFVAITIVLTLDVNKKIDKRYLVRLRKALRQMYEHTNTRFNEREFVKFTEIRYLELENTL